MSYIDGFIIAVPKENRDKFIEHAKTADPYFIEQGATRIVETWGEDVPEGKQTDFRRAVAATEAEDVVFSWIEWPSKEVRDRAMAKMMDAEFSDPRFDPARNPMPFDGKRMIFGGFSPVFELAS